MADPREACKQYRIQSVAVLLTYNGVADIAKWSRFVKQVQTHLKAWRVKHWCATLEADKEGELYIHLMWQYNSQVDRVSRGRRYKMQFNSQVDRVSRGCRYKSYSHPTYIKIKKRRKLHRA